MRLYLDDDCVGKVLVQRLRKSGHDVLVPAEVAAAGHHDAVHLRHAIEDTRVCLTRNYDDFKYLHDLVRSAQGHHLGILVIRKDSNPKHNLTVPGIVRAIARLETARVPIADEYIILNHWR